MSCCNNAICNSDYALGHIYFECFPLSGCREAALSDSGNAGDDSDCNRGAADITAACNTCRTIDAGTDSVANANADGDGYVDSDGHAATTATLDPYAALSIDALAKRTYGGGQLEIVDLLLKRKRSNAI